MKLSFSPLVFLAVLFTSALAAPTESALSKRQVDVTTGSINISNDGIVIRNVDANVGSIDISNDGIAIRNVDATTGSIDASYDGIVFRDVGATAVEDTLRT
ncbi:hypothetical protein V8E55_008334 [Tylopilus felleus]